MENNKIPNKCNRCGEEIDMKSGEPCYQKGCEYFIKTDLVDDSDGFEFEINRGKTDTDNRNDFFSINSPIKNSNESEESSESDNDGETILEEASSGCVWGFFKIIWKIVTFPFRVIWSIIAFFLDDD